MEIEDKVKEAISLYRQVKNLQIDLDELKEGLRIEAAGDKLEYSIKGEGKLSVSAAKPEKEVTSLKIDQEKLEANESLKSKLLTAGILKEETKKVSVKPIVRITLL